MVSRIKLFTKLGKAALKKTGRVKTLSSKAIKTSAAGASKKSKQVLKSGRTVSNKASTKNRAFLTRVRPSTIGKIGAGVGIASIGAASFDSRFRNSIGDSIGNLTETGRIRAEGDRAIAETGLADTLIGAGGDINELGPSFLGGGDSAAVEGEAGSGFVDTANSPIGFIALAGLAGLGIFALSKKKKK